ncbi:MAG: hypothetical protein V9E92_03025 [Methylotenera sp.]
MAKKIKLLGDSGMQENCDQMISNCDLVVQPKISQAEFDSAMQNSLKQGSCKPVMNEIGLAINMCLLATERHKVMDAKLNMRLDLSHTTYD